MATLRTLRCSRSLTFLDLAALTGIPARQLAEAEYGLRSLSADQRAALARVLGLQPNDITGSHRRSTGAQLAPAPRSDQRPLQLLAAAALTATIATSAVSSAPALRLPSPPALASLAPAPAAARAPVSATGALASLTARPPGVTGATAVEPLRRAQTIRQRRAAPPTVALSPPLLVGPPPPEHGAPAPRPVTAAAPAFFLGEDGPHGCPVATSSGRVVITQGYAVGSHAPAEVWGAIDLAVDSNSDGYAEPEASWYTPIVATHDGHVAINDNSYPGGNYVTVYEPAGVWRTGYGHLALITVVSGQFVRAGEQIGLMGNSGLTSGPHLDYQVWRSGVNVDPTHLVGCAVP